MTLIEIYIVIAVMIVVFIIIRNHNKLRNTLLFLIGMFIGTILVKLGVFFHTLWLM